MHDADNAEAAALQSECSIAQIEEEAIGKWIAGGGDVNASRLAMIGQMPDNQGHESAPALFAFCEFDHESVVRMLVTAGADVNLTDSRGIPVLSACCMYDGSPTCLDVLIDAKANVNQLHTFSCSTPLLVASHDGNVDCVRSLLAAGASMNHQQFDGNTALNNSCQNGATDCARLLREHSADVNLASNDGFTPLILASQNGHAACLELVLQRSRSIKALYKVTREGANAVVMACQNGHVRCVLMLLEAHRRRNAAAVYPSEMFKMACMVGHSAVLYVLIAHAIETPRAAMMEAIDHGHVECVMLLSSVAAARVFEQNGNTFTAEEVAHECGHLHIAAWLSSSSDWTPIHHLEVSPCARTKRLLRAGADLNARRGHPPCTPLQRADALTRLPQAAMLQQAALPWFPDTHHLFPASSRSMAVSLLFIGLQLKSRLVAAGAQGGSALAPDVWASFVMPLVVSRAQCGQKGCVVRIHGLTGSPELNGMMGSLPDEAFHGSGLTQSQRCGVQVASRAKLLSVRWQNLACRCARCLMGIDDELESRAERNTSDFGPSRHMCADDLMLHAHDEQLQSRPRPQGDQSRRQGPRTASNIVPVLLSQLTPKIPA